MLRRALVVGIMVSACSSGHRATLAFEHVTVVDVDQGQPLPDRSVVVDSGRIVYVGPASGAPAATQRVEGRGKFLIPGLWDMHVHADQAGAEVLPVLVALGITGARDMGGSFEVLDHWRKQIAADSLVGPQLVVAGPRLDGSGATASASRLVLTDSASGVKAVDSLAALGVDFIKVYEGLPRAAFFAVAREARIKHLTVGGHVPRAVPATEASDSGQRSIEHVGFVPLMCLLVKFDPAAVKAGLPLPPNCRSEAQDSAFKRFVKNGTWIDPTLVSFLGFVRAADTTRRPADALKYSGAKIRANWKEQEAGLPPWPVSAWQGVYDQVLDMVGQARKAGVALLVGTDLGNPEVYPGIGLHEEMALLVKTGLSPADALRAATLGAAQFLGLADRTGSVAVGRSADLVLLAADPLADITNSRRIDAVVRNGRYYPRATLDSLLTRAPAR